MSDLIYTLGRCDVYESYIASDPKPGKRKGGSVWQHREDVETYLRANALSDFSIYGVRARWNIDTCPDGDTGWHELLIDAPLCKL